MTAPARVVHGKPYLWRGKPDLLDVNAAILDARPPESRAVIEGQITFFEWGRHHIRNRKPARQVKA